MTSDTRGSISLVDTLKGVPERFQGESWIHFVVRRGWERYHVLILPFLDVERGLWEECFRKGLKLRGVMKVRVTRTLQFLTH